MAVRVTAGRSDRGAKPFEVMLHLGRFSIGFNVGLKHFYYKWMTDLGLGLNFYWSRRMEGIDDSQHMILHLSLLLVDLRFLWDLASKEGNQ